MARRKRCLTSVRFNMLADVLKPAGSPETTIDAGWEYQQDEDSGAIVKVWVDNPVTDIDEGAMNGAVLLGVPLIARGIIDGGVRVAGTTERFSLEYQNVDYVKATFPKGYNITKRDRVTNIRSKHGELLWKEEEMTNNPATIFNVMGVTPVTDPWGHLLEYSVLLERAEVQSV